MTWTFRPLFAEVADRTAHTVFQWGRIQSNSDWILPIVVCLVILLLVRTIYRRDTAELGRPLSWLLTALRTATFVGLLILYLQPQWRLEHEIVHNPRAVLLVDTSLSMGLIDSENPLQGTRNRVQQVAAALSETEFLDQLRETNDVVVLRFGEDLDRDPITLPKLDPTEVPKEASETAEPQAEAIDWNEFLAARGTETRLGSALRQVIDEESSSPLSGIVVFSDGGQNAGTTPEAAISLAQQADVPIFTVGLGSTRQPTNVRISDLVVPARAYPGDSYTVTGFVQAQGMAGRSVQVQLFSRPFSAKTADSTPAPEVLEGQEQVTLGADGEVLSVKFEMIPEKIGTRTLALRIENVEGDHNPDDQIREADVEIVDRKNRVLLLAGGPTREYRFLRTQLYRDRSTSVDILLQTAQPGISQEADQVLGDFPSTREEMFEYDCVVGFDPDWQALSPTQVELLEAWVGEQGGGLIVVAGGVFTANAISGWVSDPSMGTIRSLYPVEFHRRFSTVEEGMYVAEEPWPLDFTREGLETEFLWLADTAAEGRQAWTGFDGVFSFCSVRGPKPGATVLAHFSDPRTARADRKPVFLASQFFGSGRVFYIGSGEMWRLRKVDPTYFETFYTKLIRHVSQGRLLRGSSRGVLLVGRDRYLLGNTVEVRAQLTNAALEPLTAPSVPLQVFQPDGSLQTVALPTDPSRPGTYAGRFPVLKEGSYRLELSLPEQKNERLLRRIQVSLPDLERENPQRNDALLTRIAEGPNTGGLYYVGLSAMLDPNADRTLADRLKGQPKIEYIPDAPDPLWEETWLRWMMFGLCGLLCFEWLVRRLVKLA